MWWCLYGSKLIYEIMKRVGKQIRPYECDDLFAF
jgi:hypothetical protein